MTPLIELLWFGIIGASCVTLLGICYYTVYDYWTPNNTPEERVLGEQT